MAPTAVRIPPATAASDTWLGFAEAFTAAHAAGGSIAEREARCVAAQLPHLFAGLDPDDCLPPPAAVAPPLGFSPEPGGYGWYWNQAEWDGCDWTGEEAARIAELAAYWRPHLSRGRAEARFGAADAAFAGRDFTGHPGAAFPLFRIAGLTPDYARVCAEGLPGLRARVEALGSDFGAGVVQVLAGLDAVLAAWVAQAHAPLAADLQALRCGPPQSLRQALQLGWLLAVASGSLNHGRIDDWAGPYLQADLAAGRLDHDQAQALVDAFWFRIAQRGNIWNGRVIIGGIGRRDPAAADAFALLALEASDRLGEILPQLSLRLAPEQDGALCDRALELLAKGRTYPILYNDSVNVPAVAVAMAISVDEAVHYLPYGCGEYTIHHAGVDTPNGILNHLRIMEEVLFGLPCGSTTLPAHLPAEHRVPHFSDIDALIAAYEDRVCAYLDALVVGQVASYDGLAQDACLLLPSALSDDCLARNKALLAGGIRHRGGTMESYGLVNAADSLHAIEQLVFIDGHCDLDQLRVALRDDWRGAEVLRARARLVPAFGNDDAQADAWYRRLHDQVCVACQARAASAGLDHYLVVCINNSANTHLGMQTGASADGRHARTALANAVNPQPGRGRAGAMAMLRSCAAPRCDHHAGAVQNLSLSASWFCGEQPVRALLAGYWAAGGSQVMITVTAPGELKAAMERPGEYQHLMVRVGGFSARFVDLDRPCQQEICDRALH
ncbi:MAG: hypothetical protein PF961_09715 [Planctomycetota bacterium]|jgi:pyruvate-formate lyase|nr:hypothetical protein [Planctomycetota bacterium]